MQDVVYCSSAGVKLQVLFALIDIVDFSYTFVFSHLSKKEEQQTLQTNWTARC